MRAALVAGVDGILGECGGVLACGTCHAYLDAAFADKVAPMQAEEADLLALASDRRANGVILQLPASQP
jgi:2Fe-2S ferredoxin